MTKLQQKIISIMLAIVLLFSSMGLTSATSTQALVNKDEETTNEALFRKEGGKTERFDGCFSTESIGRSEGGTKAVDDGCFSQANETSGITTTSLATTETARTTYIYQYNAHGDVTKVLSVTGITLNSYKYDAFGLITEKVEVVANTFYYSGYEFDSETGLYYLRSRYYNPQITRFISEDSFDGYYTDPLSLNKYTYCHNNPISYNDPDGEAVNIIAGLFGAGLGALISGGIELVGQLVQGGEINWNAVGASAAEGAIVGGVAGLTFGNPAAIGLASMAGNAVKQGINKGFENIDVVEVAVSGATSFVGAGAGKVVGKVVGKVGTAGQALYNAGKEIVQQIATIIGLTNIGRRYLLRGTCIKASTRREHCRRIAIFK